MIQFIVYPLSATICNISNIYKTSNKSQIVSQCMQAGVYTLENLTAEFSQKIAKTFMSMNKKVASLSLGPTLMTTSIVFEKNVSRVGFKPTTLVCDNVCYPPLYRLAPQKLGAHAKIPIPIVCVGFGWLVGISSTAKS